MKVSTAHRNYALFILTLTYVFNFLDRQLLAILLEPIKQEFNASDTAMGFLYGFAFSIFYATLAIPISHVADQSNRRNILAIAAALWSIMTVFCAMANSYLTMLLIRIGVAVGEAGGVPPSQSMVNDFFPPRLRSRAMAIFSSATFIGTLLAMVGGAWIAQNYGWRVSFVIVGAPGILLALLIRFTIKEPQKGAWDEPVNIKVETNKRDTQSDSFNIKQNMVLTQGLWETFMQMWSLSSMRYTIIGCGFAGIAGYGLGYWVPTFMIRVHGSSLVEAGLLIGGLGATVGLIGSLFGGWLCDKLAVEKRQWLVLVPALSILVSLPLMLLFLYWPESHVSQIMGVNIPDAIFIYCVVGLVGSWWAAPTYIVVQELVAPHQRTLACAVLLLIMNLFGFGLGPLLVGIASDWLTPVFEQYAIRYALMLTMLSYIIAATCYYLASKTLTQQLYVNRMKH